ncbi:RING finger protein 157 [Hypsibius exemplaris]|uniref:RING-type E3 ubiquitin transferase n=1 Tax=Hypsibius exemplaris TaxID=2072580 RepID=A0A9X6RN21_HYPEX|nr:RING finger protein 157 [Hypsibius exemplaris]
MGSLLSRAATARENADAALNSAVYRYPPKAGSYFANYFIMGGERFESPQPEAYLFGENTDLNFLTGKPVAFPYAVPCAGELGRPLKSVINIRRESLRLVRVLDDCGTGASGYNIEFNFDCDVSCTIRLMYFAKEEFLNHGLSYIPQDMSLCSEKYCYKKGANQLFNQSSYVFDPSKYSDEELMEVGEKEIIPLAIQCLTADDEDIKQCHVTLAVIDKQPDGTYVVKALKQKQCIDGLCYLLQEVYGIENKTAGATEYDSGDDEYEESGGDCVVCMSDPRDTLILPCRHLCLCNGCAESLRYQANNCPICRSPFRALLQVRALQRKESGAAASSDRTTEDDENVPAGYEVVPLTEALNGPPVHNLRYQPKQSPVDSPPAVQKPVAGPRNRKRSKKSAATKTASQEVAEVVIQPASPTASVKSHISASEPDLSAARAATSGEFSKSVPRGLDYAEIVNELPICASTVRRLEDEEDGKDSDQTTDSTSSARSFSALIRHGSQESVNGPDAATPETVINLHTVSK